MDSRTLSKSERFAWPLKEFRAFLIAGGFGAGTLAAYLAHVRHVLRTAQSATPDQAALISALQTTDFERRPTFRSAWRQYVKYAASKGYELLQYDQARDDLGVIRAALPKLVELVPLTVNELYFLTMGTVHPVKDGVVFYASAYPNSKRGRQPKFLPAEPRENLKPLHAITGWAYPRVHKGIVPDDDAPFLPNEPEGDVPLSKTVINSILHSRKRKDHSSSGGTAIGGAGKTETEPDSED